MLVGLPASGKSTWILDYKSKHPDFDFQVVSSDDIIEERGLHEGLDYNASHSKHIGFAIAEMDRRFKRYVKDGANIIHDQTNLTVKTRKIHLALIKGYLASAVVFTPSHREWTRRIEKRKNESGKIIPDLVINDMTRRFEFPRKKEGFVEITHIQT